MMNIIFLVGTLLLGLSAGQVYGDAVTIKVHFQQFTNPTKGFRSDGVTDWCKPLHSNRHLRCQPVFNVCVLRGIRDSSCEVNKTIVSTRSSRTLYNIGTVELNVTDWSITSVLRVTVTSKDKHLYLIRKQDIKVGLSNIPTAEPINWIPKTATEHTTAATLKYEYKIFKNLGSYSCLCPGGFTGEHCETDINECDNNTVDYRNPCGIGGICSNIIGSYTCRCYKGFIPPDCHDRDECSLRNDMCYNGTCVNTPGLFKCICNTGFSGPKCTDEIDECNDTRTGSLNPCGTGGRCINTIGSYKCSCYRGFIPPDCRDRDECSLRAGMCNNGTCINTPGSFHCKCHKGFSGSRCTQDIDECTLNPSPCHNGGVCANTFGSFNCDCGDTGYDGNTCDHLEDACKALKPCRNNGVCSNNDSGYSCNCTLTNFQGKNCTIDVDECLSYPCHYGSTCINSVGSFVCTCPSGYTGTTCSQDVNECTQAICQHGGTCVNIPGSFNCTCSLGFKGETCNEDVDECSCLVRAYNDTNCVYYRGIDKSCMNGGICTNTIGSYSCYCNGTGYGGMYCTQDVNECLVKSDACSPDTVCENSIGSYYCLITTTTTTQTTTTVSDVLHLSFLGMLTTSDVSHITRSMEDIVRRYLCPTNHVVQVEDLNYHQIKGHTSFNISISCDNQTIPEKLLVGALGKLTANEVQQIFPLAIVNENNQPTLGTNEGWIMGHISETSVILATVVFTSIVAIIFIQWRRKRRDSRTTTYKKDESFIEEQHDM